MEGSKISSYLKTYRLKSGLTQKDLTFLLSLKSQAAISRAEKNIGKPSLRIVLAYSKIFDVEIEKLLPKMSEDINKLIINRAPLIVKDLKEQPRKPLTNQRIAFLESLYLHNK